MDAAMIDPKIFEDLQQKVDEEIEVGDNLFKIVLRLNRDVAVTQGRLCRIHSTPRAKLPALLAQVEESIRAETRTLQELAAYASNYPFYKYHHKWSGAAQRVVFTIVLCRWLGGLATTDQPSEIGSLMAIEEVGATLGVPVNLKDRDAFHITIEEYLLALTDVTEELSRLAVNSATRGDYAIIIKINKFIEGVMSGFLLLNLKNDVLRRKADGVKYHLKRVEDIIYDLTLRKLISPESETETT